MEVRIFVRIQKVIWDHFRLHAEHHAVNDYCLVMLYALFFLFLGLSRVRDKPKNVCVRGYS